jgi:hypothetical protein
VSPKENSIQIALIEWAWLKHKVTFKCNPNELVGRLGTGQIIYWKKMGLRVDWPDLEMLEPRGKYHGFIIELKRKGEQPREGQLFWLDYLAKRGYYTCWHDSFDDAAKAIEQYLALGEHL